MMASMLNPLQLWHNLPEFLLDTGSHQIASRLEESLLPKEVLLRNVPLRGRISSQMVTVDLNAVIPAVQHQQLPFGSNGDTNGTDKSFPD